MTFAGKIHAAKRAALLADYFFTHDPGLYEVFRQACLESGRDPGPALNAGPVADKN